MEGNKDCKKCELHKSAQAICLMGRGPVPCDVMIIGEAPGFREDDVGKPFAGKAGQLLDKVMQEVGLDRSKVYITNVVKCRPPENRTPSTSEIKACAEYLEQEFAAVTPKYVLLLGATALKAVLKKAKITEIHGKIFKEHGRHYLPTFHPAAALRDPRRLDPIHADFERFVGLIKRGKEAAPAALNLTIINSFDEFNDLIEDLKSAKAVAFDLETTSLEWYRPEGKINCLGLATKNKQWVLPLDGFGSKFKKSEVQQEMIEIIEEVLQGKRVIAQNGKFDNLWLRAKYGLRFPLTFDTMLAAHILDENSPNSLNYLSRAFFQAPDYDLPLKDKIQVDTGQKAKKLYTYCAYDVYYTLKLYYLFRSKLKKDPDIRKVFTRLVMPLVDIYEDAEEQGITIDVKRLEEVEQELLEDIAKLVSRLGKKVEGDVNWNSPQQVAEVLFGQWGLQPIDETPTGNPSTSESVLKMLASKHKGVSLLLKYREKHKQYSGFVKSWKNKMHRGKLHPSFKLAGTVTGRPSCSDPNLQQTPRDSLIRTLITAPKGWDLVEVDQSQVELRVAAMLSGERTMKLIFQTGGDIHTTTAQEVSGNIDVTKEERKKAKAVNFGFLYGMGWNKFTEYAREKYGVELTPGQAKAYRTRFFEKYSDLPIWHERQRRKAHMFQEVKTPTGRVRRLPSILSTDQGVRAEAERAAINSPVQGFAAEVTLMGMIEIRNRLPWSKVRPIGTIHDAILILIKKGYLDKALPIIKDAMENPPLLDTFGIRMTVPLIVEASVGNWGAGKTYKFK